MLVTALIFHAAAADGSLDLEKQRTCLLQLHKMKVRASERAIRHSQPYERKENLLCGMGLGCKVNGLEVDGSSMGKIDGIPPSITLAGATMQSGRIDNFGEYACEEACNAKTNCAGFLVSASHEHYSCDFLDEVSMNCVGTASQDLSTTYVCFKKTAGNVKYGARYNRQYDRYDTASLFDYVCKSTSCETDASSSAQELVDQVNTIRHVLDYRVGDVIQKHGYYWLQSRQNLMDERYSGTALQMMLRRCSDLNSCTLTIEDFARELASIGKARGFSKPENDTIVAYIRAGDVIDYKNYIIGKKLRDSAVMERIRSALSAGYKRLIFVVVEAYADRDEHGEKGLWMYSESKHETNRNHLLAAIRGLHEFLCAGTAQVSFGVVSPVNADETLFYLMHASMLVSDVSRAGGFNLAGKTLAQLHSNVSLIL